YETNATHTGPYMGIQPTQRRVTIPGIKILRFEDGLIAEHWSIYDYLTTAYQIGAEIELTPRPRGEVSAAEQTADPTRRQPTLAHSAPTPGPEGSEIEKHKRATRPHRRYQCQLPHSTAPRKSSINSNANSSMPPAIKIEPPSNA